MRFGDLPLAGFAGFVGVEPEPDAQLGALQPVAHTQFHGGIEGGIAAEDQQHINGAGIQIFCEIEQGCHLVGGVGFHGIGVEHRLTDVAELLIHDRGKRMNDGRLMRAGDHYAGALVGLQVARHRADPLINIVIFAGLGAFRDAQ